MDSVPYISMYTTVSNVPIENPAINEQITNVSESFFFPGIIININIFIVSSIRPLNKTAVRKTETSFVDEKIGSERRKNCIIAIGIIATSPDKIEISALPAVSFLQTASRIAVSKIRGTKHIPIVAIESIF